MMLALLSVESLISILMVALGLGMVIFFHELGHFAVAKWCNVQVERFSIGFGPILWSRKWGETEYALSAIPFGGYVKMLGQDDLDPGQETSEDVAENPRSYTAKSVPQRMAIISAGVIMNVITGYLFYVGALRMGTQVQGNEVGFVQAGMPAWEAGIREDDVLTSINGRPVADFNDVTRGTALTTGPVRLVGKHSDGEVFDLTVHPDETGTKRMIGVAPQDSLNVFPAPEGSEIPVTIPGSPASKADPGFQPGDRIRRVDGQQLDGFADLREILTQQRDKALVFEVARGAAVGKKSSDLEQVTVAPQQFRSLGLRVAAGPISDIQRGSPADRQGLEVNDRIVAVQAADAESPLEVGRGIDPLLLPDWLADHAGTTVKLTVEREGKGEQTRIVEITPLPLWNWTRDSGADVPLAIPAIGVAFHLLPTVLSVDPESAAAEAGIGQGDLITHVEFIKPENWPIESERNIGFEIGNTGWARAVNLMQMLPTWKVKLAFKPKGENQPREALVAPEPVQDWYVASDRGLQLMPLLQERKAENLSQAFALGWDQTRDAATDIYLTLRGLFSGNISPKELHGPIGIFSIGVQVASSGVPAFLIFLGFLSVNLAVLNFLPIPVLDGGHMVFLIWEGIARRRPSERVYATAMYLGMLFVLGLMGYVIYLDIMRRIV